MSPAWKNNRRLKMSSDHRIESAVGVGNHSDPNGSVLVHGAATGWDPIEACTCFQSNVNGSGDFFGKAASSAFNRSARAEIHTVRTVNIHAMAEPRRHTGRRAFFVPPWG